MFEHAELGHTVAKKKFAEQVKPLRKRLLDAQFRLAKADFPVILLIAGVDGAGKGEVVNTLSQWLDIRLMRTRAFGRASAAERRRPRFWRFWRAMPPKGQMALFLSSWYHEPLLDRVAGQTDRHAFDAELAQVAELERTLTADGTVLVKIWLHLSKDAQQQRFEQLEADPHTSWRVSPSDWDNYRRYDEFSAAAEQLIVKTSNVAAPWHVIEGGCARYRMLEIGRILADAIDNQFAARQRLAEAASASPPPSSGSAPRLTLLSKLTATEPPAKSEYREQLAKLQAELNQLHRQAHDAGIATVLVFEGWDAAGKGGAIRRVTAALDVRNVCVVPISAPSDEERQQHYLWRFWRHIPASGEVTIFDRSWYGRVLVERVMGYASEHEWRRAYAEIREFEQQLTDANTAVVKFWLHISPEEQEARFKARANTSYKSWKLTEEDWRNRERWSDYELAAHDMVKRTDTKAAPWVLIDAESKYHARLAVLRTVCDTLQQALARRESEAAGPEMKAKGTV